MSGVDIKRKTEIFLCGRLAAIVTPAHTFAPYTGGFITADAAALEPPFTVIAVTDATRTHANESTWLCTGSIQVITHAQDTTSAEHSTLAARIYRALGRITPESHEPGFSFHGLDITGQRSASDDESEARADIFDFTCGVGG